MTCDLYKLCSILFCSTLQIDHIKRKMYSKILMVMLFCCHGMATELLFPPIEDSKTVYNAMMHKYNKHILPAEGNRPFDIFIFVELTAVGEIDELEEKLSTVMELTYYVCYYFLDIKLACFVLKNVKKKLESIQILKSVIIYSAKVET